MLKLQESLEIYSFTSRSDCIVCYYMTLPVIACLTLQKSEVNVEVCEMIINLDESFNYI